MIIDLDRAIARTSSGKHDELLERAYWRRIEPGTKLIHDIALHIPGSSETVECRSVSGAMVYLAADYRYPSLSDALQLERRIAVAHGAAQAHAERGEAVAIIVDDSVILSNTDGETCDAIYDASNDRDLLASLVANKDLRLWERATSYVLRGCSTLDRVTNPNCKSCAFFRTTGDPKSLYFDRWCHSDLQDVIHNRGSECSDYYPKAIMSRRTSERFVPIRARDIWRRSSGGMEETVFDVPEAN